MNTKTVNTSDALQTFTTMLQEKVNNYFRENYEESFLRYYKTNVSVNYGKKYVKIDIGDCGKFILDVENNHLYFIKAYGVINKAKNFGELNAIINADFDYDGISIVPFKSGKHSAYGYAGAIA